LAEPFAVTGSPSGWVYATQLASIFGVTLLPAQRRIFRLPLSAVVFVIGSIRSGWIGS
jgi:hypothetical protein